MTSYTIFDIHNTNGFYCKGTTVSTPGVVHTVGDTPSGNVINIDENNGIILHSAISGLHIPNGTTITHIAGTVITISASIAGDIPNNTPLTIANPYPITVRSKDPKTSGRFYVEFTIVNAGLRFLTNGAFGIATLSAPIVLFGITGISAALLYEQGNGLVNGVGLSNILAPIIVQLGADAAAGDTSVYVNTVAGLVVGDGVIGSSSIPNGTKLVAINPTAVPGFGYQITLSHALTGPMSKGANISFTQTPLQTGDRIGVAVDLIGKTIAFRKIDATQEGPWSANIDISSLPLSGGTTLAVINGAANGDFKVTLHSDPSEFDISRTIPSGFTAGWPDNQFTNAMGVTKITSFSPLSPIDLAIRKATAETILSPPDVAVRKLTAEPVLGPPDLAARKITAETVLGPPALAARKITVYAILQATTPVPPVSYGPIPIFPDLPQGFPVRVSIVMDTITGTTKSLREVRVAQQTYPLWDIELPFEELRDRTQNQIPYAPFDDPIVFLQFTELCQLWLSMYGQTGVFAFDAPWDNSRQDQFIGTGDGITKSFTMYRSWGSGDLESLLPVGAINEIFDVQINGTTVDPTLYSTDRNKLVFTAAPAIGSIITSTFSYYYLCRFVADEQDFEEFAKNRWTVPSLKFRSVIWP